MAQRAAHARKCRLDAIAKRAAELPDDADESSRHKRVLLQIQRCDKLLEACKAEDFPSLTAAKERLWNLVFPKAGVMRPRSSGNRRAAPGVTQTPQETTPTPATPPQVVAPNNNSDA